MYVPFEQLPSESRLWVYQASRGLTAQEEKIIFETLAGFCSNWEAHGSPLMTSFKIEFQRFIILSVNESAAGASGCSIDGSVRVLKELSTKLNADLFDRTKIAFLIDGKIETYSLNQLSSLFGLGKLKPSAQTFNNFVSSKGEWENTWITTAEKSWLVKYLPKDTLSV